MVVRVLIVCFGLIGADACSSERTAPPAELMVFAASSLTESFEALADAYRVQNPGSPVVLHFAGSQSLRTQIQNGATAAVFASANPSHLAALRADGLAHAGEVFATNELVVAVPADNPAGIEKVSDLVTAERIVMAGSAVPAGAYADEMLERARVIMGDAFVEGVRARVVSREDDVRATLQKVMLGEADAAIVYVTDALQAGPALRVVSIPAELNVRATYPIARVGTHAHADTFVSFVTSIEGQRILARYGFRPAHSGESAMGQ